MGIFDILSGKQSLFKPSAGAIAQAEADYWEIVRSASVSTPKRAPYVTRDPLKGTFDSLAAARDLELARRGSGDLQSIKQLIIPVLVAGEASGSPFSLGECTGLFLAPRTTGDTGSEMESSESARIYVQINNCGVWIPMSFNISPQGSQKGDTQFIAGPIATLRVRVMNITQDVINQPNMFLWAVRGITLVGQFGGAQLYGSPINSAATSGGGTEAPNANPVSNPTQAPASNPVTTGGGSSGGSSGGGISGGTSGGGGGGGYGGGGAGGGGGGGGGKL